MAQIQLNQEAIFKTILSQMGDYNRINAMIGIKNLISCNDENKPFIQFGWKVKGSKNKSNKVKIILDLNFDNYIVEFWQIKKFDFNLVSTHSDIYADSLIELFEHETQLALSL